MTDTVVVRVDSELKRKAKAYDVNISEVVRSALREEVQKREKRETDRIVGTGEGHALEGA